jgi:hypothetical protein
MDPTCRQVDEQRWWGFPFLGSMELISQRLDYKLDQDKTFNIISLEN